METETSFFPKYLKGMGENKGKLDVVAVWVQ